MHHLIGFISGTLFAAVLGGTSRRKVWRPVAVEVMKGGIAAARKAQSIGLAIAEEGKKVAAEARAELDREAHVASSPLENEEAKDR